MSVIIKTEETMNKLSRLKFFPFIVVLMFCTTAVAVAQPPDFVTLAEQLKPAVVNIGTAKTVKPRVPGYHGPQGPHGDVL